MIKSVTVTNYRGESIKFELAFPEKSGFAVQNIDGLGPPKANINTTDSATMDGSSYNSARATSRNIVFTFKFLTKPTIEAVRQLSYKYFPIKKYIKMLFETDSRTCEASGYVESNVPVIFSNDETTQISVICPDPYFYSAGQKGTSITVFSGVEPVFEFPFSNESLTENFIEFAQIINKSEENVFYSGDIETGIIMTMRAIGNVKNVIISNTQTREIMKIDTDKLTTLTGFGIIPMDEITISTIRGNKGMLLLRNGVYTNILNCLSKDSDWFQLTKGDNLFAFTAEEGATNLQFRIENQILFEGV